MKGFNNCLLSMLHVYHGRMDAAVQFLQRARQIAESHAVNMVKPLDEALGIAYLHKAEMDNDLFRNPGERDLLTANGYQPLRKTGDLRKAVEYFQKYLAKEPNELEVKWLLNLAHMMLGGYPDKVPAAYLIPPTVFASAEEVGRFVDVRKRSGTELVRLCRWPDRRRLRQRWAIRCGHIEHGQLCAHELLSPQC